MTGTPIEEQNILMSAKGFPRAAVLFALNVVTTGAVFGQPWHASGTTQPIAQPAPPLDIGSGLGLYRFDGLRFLAYPF
jgi:hypothetical protein